MIYIITENSDSSTDKVLSYLIGNIDFVRINNDRFTKISYKISNNEIIIKIDKKKLNLTDKIWIRRARFSFFPNFNIDSVINNYLSKEENSINKSLELFLKDNYDLTGSYLKEVENYKLTNLVIARNCGFKIPNSLITTSKKDILLFYKKYKNIITKDIRYSPTLKYKDYIYTSNGTLKVQKKDLNKLKKSFFPIFFQQEIKKQIEIRVFIFKKKVFSMAIFSQSSKTTSLDYRNYDKKNPNRLVPFNLPKQMKNKILKFMKLIDLNTGSIDLILDPKGDYYFLEINPQGQYDWLSENCNYYIEQTIAKYLMK